MKYFKLLTHSHWLDNSTDRNFINCMQITLKNGYFQSILHVMSALFHNPINHTNHTFTNYNIQLLCISLWWRMEIYSLKYLWMDNSQAWCYLFIKCFKLIENICYCSERELYNLLKDTFKYVSLQVDNQGRWKTEFNVLLYEISRHHQFNNIESLMFWM